MFARVSSAAVVGIEAAAIDVEVDVAVGLPGCNIVGLADAGVREGRLRIRGALENSGFKLPPRRVTVNLAPADLRKDGAAFDVPIAVGMLCAAGVVDPAALDGTLFVGELALDGTLRPVRGVLPIAAWARGRAIRRLVVPPGNVAEAAVVADPPGLEIRAPGHIGELVALLRGEGLAGRLAEASPGPAHVRQVRNRRRNLRRPGRRRFRRRFRTWRTCAGKRCRDARWRSRPAAVTTCCSSARPVRARRCSRSGCRESCRR